MTSTAQGAGLILKTAPKEFSPTIRIGTILRRKYISGFHSGRPGVFRLTRIPRLKLKR